MKFQNDAERRLWLKVFEAFHSRRSAAAVAAKEADKVINELRKREPEPLKLATGTQHMTERLKRRLEL